MWRMETNRILRIVFYIQAIIFLNESFYYRIIINFILKGSGNALTKAKTNEASSIFFWLSEKQAEDDYQKHEQTDKIIWIFGGVKIFNLRKTQLIEININFRNLMYDFSQPIQFLSSFRLNPEKREFYV